MNINRFGLSVLLCLVFLALVACAVAQEGGEVSTSPEESPQEEEVVSPGDTQSPKSTVSPVEGLKSKGLRELLNVGIRNAVKLVGVEDGYFGNDLIKILLPEKLKRIDSVFRMFGGKNLSDDLIKKMNRAAEKAAPLALDIFVSAIKKIKFQDVVGLLSGKENAATEFLERNTSTPLKTEFYPIVKKTMEEVKVLVALERYVGKYKSTPFAKALGLDIDLSQYVTDKAIDGLFLMVAKEEKKIRENPAARVTSILKTIFGKKRN